MQPLGFVRCVNRQPFSPIKYYNRTRSGSCSVSIASCRRFTALGVLCRPTPLWTPKKYERNYCTKEENLPDNIVPNIMDTLEKTKSSYSASEFATAARKAEAVASKFPPNSEHAVRLRTAIARGWWHRAEHLEEQSAYQNALDCYKLQLGLFSKTLVAHKGMGMAMYEILLRNSTVSQEERQHQLQSAYEYLKVAVNASPRDPEVYRYIINVARELGLNIQAMDYCRRAIRKVPLYEYVNTTRRRNPAVEWFHRQLTELKQFTQ